MVHRMRDLYTERQRRQAIDDASKTADDASTFVCFCGAVLMSFGFIGFLLCATFGARLAACYALGFGFGTGAVLALLSYVVAEVVFIVKTWNV